MGVRSFTHRSKLGVGVHREKRFTAATGLTARQVPAVQHQSSETDSQVSNGSILHDRYPRSSIKALAPGGAVRAARRFSPDMVQQASGHESVRRVGPFEMRPAAGACEAVVSLLCVKLSNVTEGRGQRAEDAPKCGREDGSTCLLDGGEISL